VGPLHFYIFSAVLAYIALLARARRTPIDALLGVYVQIALIGGYASAGLRVTNAPLFIVYPPTRVRGLILGVCFPASKFDLYRRFIAASRRSKAERSVTA